MVTLPAFSVSTSVATAATTSIINTTATAFIVVYSSQQAQRQAQARGEEKGHSGQKWKQQRNKSHREPIPGNMDVERRGEVAWSWRVEMEWRGRAGLEKTAVSAAIFKSGSGKPF
jgi:hypothetical protein